MHTHSVEWRGQFGVGVRLEYVQNERFAGAPGYAKIKGEQILGMSPSLGQALTVASNGRRFLEQRLWRISR